MELVPRKRLHLRNNFPEIEVELAYKQPDVNPSTEKFSWADINLNEVALISSL